MEIDLELFRHAIVVSSRPPLRLSAIDIAPERPQWTLVFLHGFGGQAKQWIYQLRHFSMKNRVVAIDLPGHGRAETPQVDFSMDQLMEWLEAAFDSLDVSGRVALVGHSFGGALAAEFGTRHPQSVDRLVLIGTVGEFRLNPLYRLGLNLPLPILRLIGPVTRNWLSATPAALKPWYHKVLSKWNGWSLLRNLVLPTLVIHGHRDLVFSRPAFEEVVRVIPGAESLDVGASGHMVMLERREAVNRAMDRFLGGGSQSWRDEDLAQPAADRVQLVRQRPWLVHYEKDVPDTIAFPKVPVHQFLQSAERRFPGHLATLFEGARLNYRRLATHSNRLAHALRSLGLEKGDRVMLLLPNTPQLVIAYFATLKAGGVVVFTLPTTEPKDLLHQARDSGAKFVIAYSGFARLLSEILQPSDVRHVILTDIADYLPPLKRFALRLKGGDGRLSLAKRQCQAQCELHSLSELLRGHGRDDLQVEVSPDDPAVIHYTGGTTAEPKGVLLSHRNLVANTIQTRHWLPEAREGHERFLCVLPFSHSYGLTTGLNVAVALGAAMLIKARFEVRDTLRTIKRHRPTIFPGVPQMYLAISNFPGVRKYGIRSIKACISGSAPLPVEVQEAFEKLTRGRLVEGYGLTEASPVTHANPLHGRRKTGSIGIPLPSTEAKIVDLVDPRKEVPACQIGELAVRGPQVMMGYWREPKATAKVLDTEGWLLTGDVAQMDPDSYFRLIARKADMWYPGKPGNPAFPRDVEEVLYEVPQVKEAAVVAIARKPIAFVIAGGERPSADSLIAYCRRRLPPELVPRVIVFVDDFPRTFIGKVLRRELARHYAQPHSEVS